MTMTRSFAALVLLTWAAFARGEVIIERTEPVIERKTFDPKNPPADMPKLDSKEAAVTQSFFGAETRVGGDVVERDRVPDGHRSSIKVDTVRMTLRLRVTIWLPRGAVPKLVKHEDGHKDLAEHYYKDAERIARAEAEKLIGQTVSATGSNFDEAGENALKRAAEEVGQRYLGQTDVPCGKAQEIYDQITRHGTNAVTEAQAIAQSIAKVKEMEP
jgi:hypothetical protein